MAAEFASVLAWREELGALEVRLGELFVRAEPRRQAGLYLEGLLSAAKRKNGWQLGRADRRCPTLANAAGAEPRAVGPGRGPRSVPADYRHRASRGRGRLCAGSHLFGGRCGGAPIKPWPSTVTGNGINAKPVRKLNCRIRARPKRNRIIAKVCTLPPPLRRGTPRPISGGLP